MTSAHPAPNALRRPGTPRAAARARGAFSLLELTIVMLIVTVAAAVAVPRFADASARGRVRAAADRLVADIELARRSAHARSQDHVVDFPAAHDAYRFGPDSGQATTVRLDISPYGASVESAAFGAGRTLRFTPLGTPSAAGAVVLRVGDYVCAVVVDAGGDARTQAPVRQARAPATTGPVTPLGEAGATASENATDFEAGGG
jgi:Tfp pilus assembly protein FimT